MSPFRARITSIPYLDARVGLYKLNLCLKYYSLALLASILLYLMYSSTGSTLVSSL
jgi:hypothetical protein